MLRISGCPLRIEIGKQRGREDREGCLANADRGVPDEQRVVVMHEGGEQRGCAPDERSGDDERLAGQAVAGRPVSGAMSM